MNDKNSTAVTQEVKPEPKLPPENKRWLVFSMRENTSINVLNVCEVYENALEYAKNNAVYNMGRPVYLVNIKEFRKA